MDQDRRESLQKAMISWKAKGNLRLAEACASALEEDQRKVKSPKAA